MVLIKPAAHHWLNGEGRLVHPSIPLTISRRGMLAGAMTIPFADRTSAASSFLSRVMVQGRPQDTGSHYKVRSIMPALDALGGVRKMRCRAPFRNTLGWRTYEGLAAAGVKFCFTLPIKDPATLIGDMAAFEQRYPGATFAIEFPNEPDLNPVQYKGMTDPRLGARIGNAPALMAFCRDVTDLLSRTPELKAIPRVAFNDWMPAEQNELVTYANSHIYPKPTAPSDAWLTGWHKLLAASGKSQGFITEWGRSTGGGSGNVVAPPVTLQQQADLLESDLRSVLSQPSVAIISIYELFSWSQGTEQNNFGLFNHDLTPRPVVNAIRSILF